LILRTAIEDCREKAECTAAMTATTVEEQPAPPRKKSRSDLKRTPQMLAGICELVKQGLSLRRAAEHLKVHHSTVAAWRSQDPQFDVDVAAAEAQFIQGQLEIIQAAAKKGSWQASAWILERRLPAEFSQPQVQLSMPVNDVEYKELSVVLEELKQCPEARRLLPPEIWGLAGQECEQSNVESKDAAPGDEGEDAAPANQGEAISQSEQKTR
jgi:hypothetical protein